MMIQVMATAQFEVDPITDPPLTTTTPENGKRACIVLLSAVFCVHDSTKLSQR